VEGYAFFDVDHTILNGSTGTEITKEGVRSGIVPFTVLLRIPWLFLKYRLGGFDIGVLEHMLRLLEGVRIDEIGAMGRRVFARTLEGKIFREALDLMEEERRLGREAVLATSSLDYAVQPLAEYLGVNEIISTSLETKEGVITGRFTGIPAFGPGKHRKTLRYLEEKGVEAGECSFYTDSYYDMPLLERVGKPVAVNPDRRLRREAERRGWRIMRFTRTLDMERGR